MKNVRGGIIMGILLDVFCVFCQCIQCKNIKCTDLCNECTNEPTSNCKQFQEVFKCLK